MDKNYAHIFIFWDRLFGTFKNEEEEPDYGITSGFINSSAYNATFSYLIDRGVEMNIYSILDNFLNIVFLTCYETKKKYKSLVQSVK